MHTGMSWAPPSRLGAARPLDVEPVAADFPKLRLILAHMGWPWVLDAAALALKYEHVYLDTAAVYAASPRETMSYLFGGQLPLAFADRNLSDKILFGSNYPRVDPGKVLAAVRDLPLSPDTLELVLHGNAARLLGLSENVSERKE
jgi:predicted TIM-barrel fold metal-dependent hydrolase